MENEMNKFNVKIRAICSGNLLLIMTAGTDLTMNKVGAILQISKNGRDLMKIF